MFTSERVCSATMAFTVFCRSVDTNFDAVKVRSDDCLDCRACVAKAIVCYPGI